MLRHTDKWFQMALAGVRREFPNKVSYLLTNAEELLLPRDQTPIFFGCFDWHSAVHSHWSLVQLYIAGLSVEQQKAVEEDLQRWITPEHIATETAYLQKHPSFENPYGLVWLLHLCQSLRDSHHEWMQSLGKLMVPLEEVAATNLERGFRALPHPVRHGLHGQTAFALGMMLDWAQATCNKDAWNTMAKLAKGFYPECRNHIAVYEPSGYDFLSSVLAEARVMASVLDSKAFTAWWRNQQDIEAMTPLEVTDPSNGYAVHYAGLNLSRAWMLLDIAAALPTPASGRLTALSQQHADIGLNQIDVDEFAGSHWLATFAIQYFLTRQRHSPV